MSTNSKSLITLNRAPRVLLEGLWEEDDYPGLILSWTHPLAEKINVFDLEEDIELFPVRSGEFSVSEIQQYIEQEGRIPMDALCLDFFMKNPVYLGELIKKWPAVRNPRLESISFLGTLFKSTEESFSEYVSSILFEVIDNDPTVVPFEVHTVSSWIHEAVPVFNPLSERVRQQIEK